MRAAGPKSDVYRHPPNAVTAELLGYTVIPLNGMVRAVPPGALRLGSGIGAFEIVVERIVDMGNHRHVIGYELGATSRVRIDVRLPEGTEPPVVGSRVSVEPEVSLPLD
ncbi:MAG: hypothetical protein ACT4PJ_14130 [Gemmatimonadaceae bacterium]